MSGKYSQNLLDHAEQSATDAFKTPSKKSNSKTPEAIGNFIGNKIANKFQKFAKNSRQSNSEIVTNEHDKEIPKERYLSPEERQKNIDHVRLI